MAGTGTGTPSAQAADFNARVDIKLGGIPDAEYPSASRDEQIKAALERYSKDRPKEYVVDLTGDGGNYYEIATTTFSEWVGGFSRVFSVEYPAAVVANDEAPTYLEDGDWRDDYYAGDKRYLYLPNNTPAATEKIRITYIVPYLLSGTPGTTDTPAQDFDAICSLAAGLCCEALAAKYGQSMDPTLAADVVNYAEKTDFYARRAKELIALYEEHMGIEEGTAPASVVSDWDVEETYLFHGRRTR